MADNNTILVAFQGKLGAYSQIAISKYFEGRHANIATLPCQYFADVFEELESARAQFAVLPIENSLAGSVHEVYDLFLAYKDLVICGETRIRVEHALICYENADIPSIQTVFSHPQALAQCAQFFQAYPHITLYPYFDTAAAVEHIVSENNIACAAIAHRDVAKRYSELQVLQNNIETNPHNFTRFVVLKRQDTASEEVQQKASIVFSTLDKPGALLHCMEQLSKQNLNLRKIESRPIHGRPWEYMFYLDVDIEHKLDAFQTALSDMSAFSKDLRILGTYARG